VENIAFQTIEKLKMKFQKSLQKKLKIGSKKFINSEHQKALAKQIRDIESHQIEFSQKEERIENWEKLKEALSDYRSELFEEKTNFKSDKEALNNLGKKIGNINELTKEVDDNKNR